MSQQVEEFDLGVSGPKKEDISRIRYDLTPEGLGIERSGVKVLMITNDRTVFDGKSDARLRILEYGMLVKELHVIIFNHVKKHGFIELEPDEDCIEIADNVFLYPTNSGSKLGYIRNAVSICKKIVKDKWLKETIKCLVTVQDPYETIWAGRRIKKKFKIPLHVQIHTDFLSPYFYKQSALNGLRVMLAKYVISDADQIRVVSKRIKRSMTKQLNIYEDKITILPIFTDILKVSNTSVKTHLHQKYPQFDFIILMASRLVPEKNIGMAIDAFKVVLKQNPKAGLLIVGDGPEKEKLKSKVFQTQAFQMTGVESFKLSGGVGPDLSKNIIFENAVDFDILISYYKSADLFLLTSNYEGYGRTIVEALAARCPVLMTGVGVAGEYVKNGYNGFIIQPKDRKNLEKTLRIILKNPNILSNFKENGYNMVRGMPTKEEYLEQYKRLWEKCFE